jgi:hypothetical protein
MLKYNAFHAYGHLWIYDLMGTYAMMHFGMGIWSRWYWACSEILGMFSYREKRVYAGIQMYYIVYYGMRAIS